MREQSRMFDVLVRDGRIAIVGAMYEVVMGKLELLQGISEPYVASGAGSTMDMTKMDWSTPNPAMVISYPGGGVNRIRGGRL